MSALLEKVREVVYSVLPVIVIVFVLHITATPLGGTLLARFSIGAILVIMGLTLFLLGVDKAITPLGNVLGETMAASNRAVLFIITALFLGIFITLAEPGLLIFSGQVERVTFGQISSVHLLLVISAGIGVFLAIGLLRIVFNIALYKLLTAFYLLIFLLGSITQPEFLIIAFDGAGATTGVLAVPFILALTVGVSHLKRSSVEEEEDSFGTISIVSAGAIIAVMFFSILQPDIDFLPGMEDGASEGTGVLGPFAAQMSNALFESVVVVFPLVFIFLGFHFFFFRLRMSRFRKIIIGFAYSFFGLFLFLLGINAGFMDVGTLIGGELALYETNVYIIIIAFFLGVVTVIAEPAVHVLTQQVEEVTTGYVSGSVVMVAMSIGVGLAIALAVLRVFIEPLQIWHYLLPGYAIAIGLMYVTPKTFVGMAFDAGGVATGPIIATFVLAFLHGAANNVETADVILDGFGMIAMVALMPIITLQILGLVFKAKIKKKGV